MPMLTAPKTLSSSQTWGYSHQS